MQRSHCHAIRYQCQDCSWDFFEILGFNTKWWGWICSSTICCARLPYDHDCAISDDTIWTLLQIRSDTFGQDWSDPVHDGVRYNNHNRGSRFGTMWNAHIHSDAFISKGYALLWQDMIRALTRILKTCVPGSFLPKIGSPTIQKNIASLKI